MKILVVSSKWDGKEIQSGVDYHRLYAPLKRMEKDYQDYEFTLVRTPFHLPEDKLKEYDICVFSAVMLFTDNNKKSFGSKETIKYLQDLGINVICDIDDTWKVDKHHSHYNLFNYNMFKGKSTKTHIIDSILNSDVVTTTNQILAKDIQGLSNAVDVEIIPNGIDRESPQFSTKKNRSKDYISFGYAKVASQKEDLKIMDEFLKWAYNQPKFRLKFVGYDGGAHHRKVHSVLSQKEEASTKQYGFVPRVSPHLYGIGYQDIDVLITPLANTHFNNCKSNLKQIECAFTDTIFMGSNVPPYSKTNFGIKFNDAKDLMGYTEQILEDFEAIKEVSVETSKNLASYDLKEVNKKRDELFKSFI